MFFIGIDEAGYGPLLGPLVVGGVMLRCPCEPTPDYLWRQMRGTLARKPGRKEARLVVCDSKLLSSRPDGLSMLETAALVATRMAGVEADSWRTMLAAFDPQVCEHLNCTPWDADGDLPLPHAATAGNLAIHTNAVRRAAERAGCTFEAIAATILPPVRYNQLLSRVDNKATVLWMATTWVLNRLLQRAAAIDPTEPVVAILDRQGGRTDYRPSLVRSFEPLELTELEHAPERSRYRIVLPVAASNTAGAATPPTSSPNAAVNTVAPSATSPSAPADSAVAPASPPPTTPHAAAPINRPGYQTVDLTFMMDADGHCCTTAWASILAKYTREICMARLNRWWQQRIPDLAPTAGYLPDGRRFANQVHPHCPALNIHPDTLIRLR